MRRAEAPSLPLLSHVSAAQLWMCGRGAAVSRWGVRKLNLSGCLISITGARTGIFKIPGLLVTSFTVICGSNKGPFRLPNFIPFFHSCTVRRRGKGTVRSC